MEKEKTLYIILIVFVMIIGVFGAGALTGVITFDGQELIGNDDNIPSNNNEIKVTVDYDYWLIERGEIRVDGEYYCSATTSVRGYSNYWIDKDELSVQKETYNISLVYVDLEEDEDYHGDYMATAYNVHSSVKFRVGGGTYNTNWYVSVVDQN